jgi:hypothetical protein
VDSPGAVMHGADMMGAVGVAMVLYHSTKSKLAVQEYKKQTGIELCHGTELEKLVTSSVDTCKCFTGQQFIAEPTMQF